MRHEPALDGLRGLAVAGVVAFHAGAPWAVGGYLGVSTFFTLSGFLITSLLLARPELVGFWARRARRLLPAALVCIVAVAALAPLLASDPQLRSLRGDALASLLSVANWRFVVDDRSYADLFSAPSPLLHFWSLAIEQQLYVVVPLVVVLVRRRALPWVLGVGVVGSVVASLLASESTAYFSTFVRSGELLVGALLALLGAAGGRFRLRGVPRTLGVAALAVLVVLWATVSQGSDWLYAGGFVVHAVLSAVIIVAATGDGGVVRGLLSWSPLRALGRVSYGVYLFHLPVLVWMDSPIVVELAVSLVIAVASYVLVEQPVRQRRVPVPRVALPAAIAVVAAVVVVATLSPPADPFAQPVAVSGPRAVVLASAPRVAIFGDSTALRTGYGLLGHGWTTGTIDVRTGGTQVGCPIARGGLIDYVAAIESASTSCDAWPATWASIVAAEDLDVALVQAGPWDVTERRLPGTDEWVHVGDEAFDALLRAEVALAVDVLSAGGATVVWLTTPHFTYATDPDHPVNEPTRVDRLNALVRDVVAGRDDVVVLDVAARIEAMGDDARPDGVHLTDDAAAELAPWLAERIVEIARRQ